MATLFIVIAIALFVVWVNRERWFGWSGRVAKSTTSQPAPPLTPAQEAEKKARWKEARRISAIISLWVLAYLAIWVFFPDFAIKHELFSPKAGFLVLMATVAGINMAQRPYFKERLSRWMMWATVVLALLFVFMDKNPSTNEGVTEDAVAESTYSFPEELEGNSVARETYNLWMRDSGLTRAEAYEMFEVCREESQQFTDFVGKNPDGSANGAVGPCHVKPGSWGDKAKDLGYDNLTDTEENVRMAIWIRNNDPDWESKWALLPKVRENRGGQATTGVLARMREAVSNTVSATVPSVSTASVSYPETVTVLAPAGTSDEGPWSPVINTPWQFKWSSPEISSFAFRKNGKDVVTCEAPCKDFSIGSAVRLEVQSRGPVDVPVTIDRLK